MPAACMLCKASIAVPGQEQVAMPAIQTSRAKELAGFLKTVPAVKHAFAYGSGIFKQEGLYTGKQDRPMLDFILAVDDPIAWHDENILENRRHYSSLAKLGGKSLVCNSEKLGAGVHFNPAVSWGKEVVKYGVVRKHLLHQDLMDWDRLYVAGRMQKPILTLKSSESIEAANYQNRVSSLVASLLLLPEKFKSQDLFKTIVGLSYLGDVRMGLAEDSRKVDRIAASSSNGLDGIYRPIFQENEFLAKCSCSVQQVGNSELWHQDGSEEARVQLINQLPKAVKFKLKRQIGRPTDSFEEVAEELAESPDRRHHINQAIAAIVGPSSRGQAVAGLFMAGPSRSASYVLQKMKKKFQ